MDTPKSSTRDLEATLNQRVRRAYALYAGECDRFSQILKQQDSCEMNSEGAFSIRRARERESRALQEYARILKVFKDLVIDAIVPVEEP